MERFLRRFVPNYESVEDPAVRKAYGTFSSVVGICCNVVLFLLKYVMGSLSHSHRHCIGCVQQPVGLCQLSDYHVWV